MFQLLWKLVLNETFILTELHFPFIWFLMIVRKTHRTLKQVSVGSFARPCSMLVWTEFQWIVCGDVPEFSVCRDKFYLSLWLRLRVSTTFAQSFLACYLVLYVSLKTLLKRGGISARGVWIMKHLSRGGFSFLFFRLELRGAGAIRQHGRNARRVGVPQGRPAHRPGTKHQRPGRLVALQAEGSTGNTLECTWSNPTVNSWEGEKK